MFFFIGGITPRITVLDDRPVLCPVCGLAQARYRRVDYYLNLFFIPLFRVRKGEPFLMCDHCEQSVQDMGEDYHRMMRKEGADCPRCGRRLHPGFRFCPYCGRPQDGTRGE